jgi:hypothetical protein
MTRSLFSFSTVALSASVLTLLGSAAPALADFVVPDGTNYAWTRGVTANSTYAQWERFTTTAGPNTPDVGAFAGGTLPGSAPAWNTFDRNSFSFITGGGNIYSPSGIVAPQVDIPSFDLGAGYSTTILLQVRTQGTEIDPASVLIGGVAPVQSTELFRQALGGFGGFLVDTLYRFELPGNAAGYTAQFQALGSSMSLDRVAVDTFTVIPAPGAAALLAVGGLVASRRRRA